MIRIIAAMTEGRVIGNKGGLPWQKKDVPGELAWFEECTKGSVVIMGKRTWESLPEKYRPLPDRVNVIISNTMTRTDNLIIFSSLIDALTAYKDVNVWIIGGAALYAEGLQYADELFLTKVVGEFAGDTFFPEFENIFVRKENLKEGNGWTAQRFARR